MFSFGDSSEEVEHKRERAWIFSLWERSSLSEGEGQRNADST